MQTTTYTEFRQNLASIIDNVGESHEPVIITRGKASPAVLMSLEDYNSFTETMHLMASATNAGRLNDAIANLHKGGGEPQNLVECD